MVLETVVAIVAAHDDMKGLVFAVCVHVFAYKSVFFDVFMSFRPWSGYLDGRLEENLPFASMRHSQTIRQSTITHKNVKNLKI